MMKIKIEDVLLNLGAVDTRVDLKGKELAYVRIEKASGKGYNIFMSGYTEKYNVSIETAVELYNLFVHFNNIEELKEF